LRGSAPMRWNTGIRKHIGRHCMQNLPRNSHRNGLSPALQFPIGRQRIEIMKGMGKDMATVL